MKKHLKNMLDKLAAVAAMSNITLADYAHEYLQVSHADKQTHQWTWADLMEVVHLDIVLCGDMQKRMEGMDQPKEAEKYQSMLNGLNEIRVASCWVMPKEVHDEWAENSRALQEIRRRSAIEAARTQASQNTQH